MSDSIQSQRRSFKCLNRTFNFSVVVKRVTLDLNVLQVLHIWNYTDLHASY